jgi:hypothetical protein
VERKQYSPAKKKASKNKKFYWRYPSFAEIKIADILNKELKLLSDQIRIHFTTYISNFDPKAKHDVDPDEEYYLFLQDLRKEVDDKVNDEQLLGLAFVLFIITAKKVSIFNEKELERFLAMYGIKSDDIVPNLNSISNLFYSNVRQKLQATIDSLFQRSNTYFLQWKKGELTKEAYVKKMQGMLEAFSTKKGTWISRDTIGTLNYAIQRDLLTNAGLNYYLWSTSEDERVRGNPDGLYPKAIPSHWLMANLLCRWDNETLVSHDEGRSWVPKTAGMEFSHPGQARLCRCVGSPFIANILDEVDRSL